MGRKPRQENLINPVLTGEYINPATIAMENTSIQASHSAKTLAIIATSLCLGRREVYIGNMDGRWILFSWEKDLSLEVVPSLYGKII